jgi:hypothetical protein
MFKMPPTLGGEHGVSEGEHGNGRPDAAAAIIAGGLSAGSAMVRAKQIHFTVVLAKVHENE